MDYTSSDSLFVQTLCIHHACLIDDMRNINVNLTSVNDEMLSLQQTDKTSNVTCPVSKTETNDTRKPHQSIHKVL